MNSMGQSELLPFGVSSPFYEMLPDAIRAAVDNAAAAMFQSLRDQDVVIPVSGHPSKVVNEIGRWLVETGVAPRPKSSIQAGESDPGHAFMEWWRTSNGMDPERARTGYFAADESLFDT